MSWGVYGRHKIVSFDQTDGPAFSVLIGNGPVMISDGYGGWTAVARPQNKPLTRWDGAGPLTLQIPLLFDRVRQKERLEDGINRVLDLGRAGGGTQEPQPFKVTGSFLHSGKRFVMAGSPEISNIERGDGGKLMRLEMTITVMEYVRPDRIKFRKLAKKKRKVKAKKGDTINKIASRIFRGKPKRVIQQKAKAMAKLNDVRDRSKKLKQGRIIKVPK